MSVHDDTLQGLQELLAYVKGDKTKGRTVYVEEPDADPSYLIYKKVSKMSDLNKQRVAGYIDGLLQVSGQ